jgi:hypothetical protein
MGPGTGAGGSIHVKPKGPACDDSGNDIENAPSDGAKPVKLAIPFPKKSTLSFIETTESIESTLNVRIRPLLTPTKRQLVPQYKSDPAVSPLRGLPSFRQTTAPPSPRAVRAPCSKAEANGLPDWKTGPVGVT